MLVKNAKEQAKDMLVSYNLFSINASRFCCSDEAALVRYTTEDRKSSHKEVFIANPDHVRFGLASVALLFEPSVYLVDMDRVWSNISLDDLQLWLNSPYRFFFRLGSCAYPSFVHALLKVGLMFVPHCFRVKFMQMWSSRYGPMQRITQIVSAKDRSKYSNEVHFYPVHVGSGYSLGVDSRSGSPVVSSTVVDGVRYIQHKDPAVALLPGVHTLHDNNPTLLEGSFRIPASFLPDLAVNVVSGGEPVVHSSGDTTIRYHPTIDVVFRALDEFLSEFVTEVVAVGQDMTHLETTNFSVPLGTTDFGDRLGKEVLPVWSNKSVQMGDAYRTLVGTFDCVCFELFPPFGMYALGGGWYTNSPGLFFLKTYLSDEFLEKSWFSKKHFSYISTCECLEYTRVGNMFFDLVENMDFPGRLHRVSSPTGYSPFFCETVVDYLYWKLQGKTRLWVYPLGVEDPEVVCSIHPTHVGFLVLRSDVVYVGSAFRPCQNQKGAYSGPIPFGYPFKGVMVEGMFFFCFSTTGFFSLNPADSTVPGYYCHSIVVRDSDHFHNLYTFQFKSCDDTWFRARVGDDYLFTINNGRKVEDGMSSLIFATFYFWDVPPPKSFIRSLACSGFYFHLSGSYTWDEGEYDRLSENVLFGVVGPFTSFYEKMDWSSRLNCCLEAAPPDS